VIAVPVRRSLPGDRCPAIAARRRVWPLASATRVASSLAAAAAGRRMLGLAARRHALATSTTASMAAERCREGDNAIATAAVNSRSRQHDTTPWTANAWKTAAGLMAAKPTEKKESRLVRECSHEAPESI